jgi:hypothetical protein
MKASIEAKSTFGVAVKDVLRELSEMLAGDGARLEVARLEAASGEVGAALVLEGADCAECVLPPDRLGALVTARLRERVPGFVCLHLDDPRVESVRAAGAPATGPLTTLVLDPTAGVAPGDPDPGPSVGMLAGKRVGIRVDVLWAAWDWTVEEWMPRLEGAGAVVTTWRRAQGVKGLEGERLQGEYDGFVGGIDALISGLANCGSCTSWSVNDGLNGLNRGLPTVVAVTENFEPLARTLAADRGRPGLRLLVLPFSLPTLPEENVRQRAREAYPQLLDVLGARVS